MIDLEKEERQSIYQFFCTIDYASNHILIMINTQTAEIKTKSPQVKKHYKNVVFLVRAKSIFEILPCSGAVNMLTSSIIPFQRGIVNVCRSKGCRVMIHQLWRWSHCPGIKLLLPACVAAKEFFSNLHLWWRCTLQSFDLLRPTVNL